MKKLGKHLQGLRRVAKTVMPHAIDLIVGLLVGLALYYMIDRKREKITEEIVRDKVSLADRLFEGRRFDLAVAKYMEVEDEVSAHSLPEIYVHQRTRVGDCYLEMAYYDSTEAFGQLADLNYQDALRSCDSTRFPIDHALLLVKRGTCAWLRAQIREAPYWDSVAIELYMRAMPALDLYDRSSLFEPHALNELAIASVHMAALGLGKRHLDRAFELLRATSAAAAPSRYEVATFHNTTGLAKLELARSVDPARNLRTALAYLDSARQVFTLESMPKEYAMACLNSGSAYRQLSETGERSELLDSAEQAYRASLAIYTESRYPMDFSRTMQGLGNVLSDRCEQDRDSAFCVESTECFESALRALTVESYPIYFAETENDLGNTYRRLGNLNSDINALHLAIDAYHRALSVFTNESYPTRKSTVESNLMAVYGSLAQLERGEVLQRRFLELAIASGVSAMDACDSINSRDCAGAALNLGNLYYLRSTVLGSNDDLRFAGERLEASASYFTSHDSLYYAFALSGLASVYAKLGEESRDPEHFQKAISAYEQCIDILTNLGFDPRTIEQLKGELKHVRELEAKLKLRE